MKRIPPELDSLMWTLAEDGNERAIDEFGARHVEHRAELLRRIAMVKGLRGEKKRAAEPAKAIPRFTPKETKSHGPTYVVTGLVLAAICALTFAVTTIMTPLPHPPRRKDNHQPIIQNPSQDPVVQKVPTEPPVFPTPEIKTKPSKPEEDHDTILNPVTLRIDHAPLLTVFELMSQKCHVDIQPAPGMPNPDVVVDYANMNAMQMLQDLGHQYGFTPFDQHDGSILVVPAVDNGSHSFRSPESPKVDRQKIAG